MKFPLPADTLPTLLLSPQDTHMIEDVAESVVKNTFQQYYEHITVHNGVVDEKRWKKIRQRASLRVYKERKSSFGRSAAYQVPKGNVSGSTEKGEVSEVMSALLVFGSIPGNLDDVMYGMLSPSLEEMQLKSAYMEDGFVDWGLLSSIIKPTKEDPFRELSLKWIVKGHPLLVGAVMRIRDGVFIDSVGVSHLPSGERIGYHLYHSVDIPEARNLLDLQIVRSKFSVCEFFRQRSDNSVEVYGCGVFSPMGDAPASLAAATTAEVAVSVFKHMHCAEMKKLTRIVCAGQEEQCLRSTTNKSGSFDSPMPTSDLRVSTSSSSSSSSSKTCEICSQSVGGGLTFTRSKEKHCRICSVRLCSRCRVHKIIHLPTSIEKQISSMKMAFCMPCIQTASAANSAKFAALDALASEGESVDYLEALQ